MIQNTINRHLKVEICGSNEVVHLEARELYIEIWNFDGVIQKYII